MRSLKTNVWRALEWIAVMTSFIWLLAHACHASGATARKGRLRAKRRRSAAAPGAVPASPPKEILRRSAVLS